MPSSSFSTAGLGGGGSGGMSPSTGGTNAGQGGVPIKAAPPQARVDSYFVLQGTTLDFGLPACSRMIPRTSSRSKVTGR